ncbi:helix-turn-helix domain-containing protein [Novosphingobium organovorum]|uniref:helix-turn-helix domain-containing protein n=1 Tax=Novosphingobium organovorum TaxID=2930092 RepID=UPI002E12AD99
MRRNENPVPLAYSVRDAAIVTSLSRPRIYQLIAEGKIETRKLGRRTIVLAESLRRLVEEGC